MVMQYAFILEGLVNIYLVLIGGCCSTERTNSVRSPVQVNQHVEGEH